MTENNQNVNDFETVETQQQGITEQNSDESTKLFTKDEVNEIVKKRLAKDQIRAEKKQKEAIAEAIAEYKNTVKEDERLANLSEAERLSEELNKANAQIEELQAIQKRSEMLTASRSELQKIGLDVDDTILNIITADNAENTKANIEAFEKFTNDQRTKWEAERAKGITPQNLNNDNNEVDPFKMVINKYS